MARVAHLTSHHAANDIRIYRKECLTLAQAGHEVTYVVPSAEDVNDGKVRISSVPVPRTRTARFVGTTWNVLRQAVREDADIYHFHDADLMPVGIALKLLGKKVVYDVHEDVPRQVLSKHWIPIWLRNPTAWLIEALEFVTARLVDAVITATPHIARRFPSRKAFVVQNFPIVGELVAPELRPQACRPREFIYVGGMTQIRGLRECVEAMEAVNRSHEATLVLVGSISPDEFSAELRALEGWKYVRYDGPLDRPGVAARLANARAGLVLFHPVPNHVNAQPNKLFEYMSAGIPVIASDFPAWREMVGTASCGLLADPMDPTAIAEAMIEVLDDPEAADRMGENGVGAVAERYNWANEASRLLEVYRRLAPLER